jgi:hypothetical protein
MVWKTKIKIGRNGQKSGNFALLTFADYHCARLIGNIINKCRLNGMIRVGNKGKRSKLLNSLGKHLQLIPSKTLIAVRVFPPVANHHVQVYWVFLGGIPVECRYIGALLAPKKFMKRAAEKGVGKAASNGCGMWMRSSNFFGGNSCAISRGKKGTSATSEWRGNNIKPWPFLKRVLLLLFGGKKDIDGADCRSRGLWAESIMGILKEI